MIIKEERATLIPPMDETGLTNRGWIHLDDGIWTITNWHSFDDFGSAFFRKLERLTISKDGEVKKIYSYDEGETFTYDV